MIRVANILTEGRFGGPQHRVLQVAARLRQHGIETTVILPSRQSKVFREKLQDAGIRSIDLRLHRLTRHKTHLLAWIVLFLPEVASLTWTLIREEFDIVHCNGAGQVKPVLAGWLAGKKVVLHLNDTGKSPVTRLLFTMLQPLCGGFIYAAEKCRIAYPIRSNGAVLETVVPAPVDTRLYDPRHTEPEESISKAPGFKVVSIANINPMKGLEFFAEAASLLLEEGLDISFHVVGTALDSQRRYTKELYDQVASLPEGRFVFHGPSSRIPEVHKSADVFVCSSIAEASPMSVWEAMAMGKAIVSTDVGDVARHIENGHSGFIVPVRDARALAEGISRLVEDAELREVFGVRAREAAVASLDVSACVEGHRRFYETLLADG